MGGTHSSPLFLFAPVCRWAAAKHEKLWRFNVCCSSVCIEWIKFQSNMQSAPKFQFYFTCIGIIILWDACVFCVSGGPGREFTDWLAEWLSGRHSKPVYLSAQNVLLNIENCTITTRMPSMWTQLTQLRQKVPKRRNLYRKLNIQCADAYKHIQHKIYLFFTLIVVGCIEIQERIARPHCCKYINASDILMLCDEE